MEQLGVQEARESNGVFVNLRIGKIAQTSKEFREGFIPAETTNKSGTKNNFYAKAYDSITGYVDEIKWHTHELPDGTVLKSWNITINTGAEEPFILSVGQNDRPFTRLMNVLCNIKFDEPVRFVGFMDRSTPARPQKVLCLYQGGEKPVQPLHRERWLSQQIVKKLKEKIELTEQEAANVVYLENGKIDGDFPYIKQGRDDKWSFDAWTDFLMERMYEDVIPAVEVAKENRGEIAFTGNGPSFDDIAELASGDEFSGATPTDDSDIPF